MLWENVNVIYQSLQINSVAVSLFIHINTGTPLPLHIMGSDDITCGRALDC